MSLLTICQEAAGEIGISEPITVIGNLGSTAKQLLRLANRSGKVLASKNWVILQKEHTFTTSNGVESYAMPADYSHQLDGTAWDRTNYWNMRGGLDPWEWQIYKSAILSNQQTRKRYRIRGSSGTNKFFIDPIPTAAEDIVFEYVSSDWTADSGKTMFSDKFIADSDISLLDEDLLTMSVIYRFLKKKGFDYAEEYNEYRRMVDRAFARDGGIKRVIFSGGNRRFDWRMNVQESGYG